MVELLVVIAIIGILVALLLPAVQAAREAARRAQCKDNVKNIALGCLLHEDTHGFLPSGGWSFYFTADPNRGYGHDQPGSWMYSILTYIEEQALRDLGSGQAIRSRDFQEASKKLHQTPVSIFTCPSRRAARPYLARWLTVYEQPWIVNLARTSGVVQSDYAANTGDSRRWDAFDMDMPSSYSDANGFDWPRTNICTRATSRDLVREYENCQTGVMYIRSEIKFSRITDGITKTYLVGEKYLNPLAYEGEPDSNTAPGFDWGGNQSMYCGFDWDNQRVAFKPSAPGTSDPLGSTELEDFYQPRQDRPKYPSWGAFGSAHPSGFHMAFCDGSVQSISYNIDAATHRFLANRNDGQTITDNSY